MRLDETPFVGSARAREVHGHSAGGDLVLVGSTPPDADLLESLDPFGLRPAETPHLGGRNPLDLLATVAEASATAPLVVVASGLRVSPVALLDLLDRPGDRTATLTVDAADLDGDPAALTTVRVEAEQALVHSVGTARHAVTNPTALGLGVLRVASADRTEAAHLWRTAADSASATDPGVDPFDLALLALVAGGLAVQAVPLGPFTLHRGAATSQGARGSAWQQRLRGASRGGDGFFSTFVIRPLSRRVTAVGLRLGWSPNVVTVTSLGLGLLGAALAAVDDRWTWVAAALLLQVAIVVDCVDGEIARFTRRFSALGAWLDAVGDRVKEYALIAAVAVVAVHRGEHGWWLAVLALVLITSRHLEDYAYVERTRQSRAHLAPDRVGVDEPRDLGPAGARLDIAPPRTGRAVVAFWAKKVVHMPIAERYLVLSVGLLTFEPRWVLWAICIAVTVALLWTGGGRTAKAVLGRDGYRPAPGDGDPDGGHLDRQLDLGPLAWLAGRVTPLPFPTAYAGVAVLLAAALVAGRAERSWPVVALVALGVLAVGAGAAPPLRHLLAWQLPFLLWAAEAAVVVGLCHALPEGRRWVVFAYLSALAWHRYDVVYRLRDIGRASPPWLTAVTLGIDGRLVVLTVAAAVGWPLDRILPWAALVLVLTYAAESAGGWRAWACGRTAGPETVEVA